MAVGTSAAPAIPWSKALADPQIDASAYIHAFSNVVGDVRVGANVLIAPGTSIRADEGTPFRIGDGTRVQNGVIIHGLENGRVLGDDDRDYSVWIGRNTSIAHMALIQGPAYIGDRCFIGLRSTVFNARLGEGCVVMMHALVQNVEVPAGKYVPSGAVITEQQQADRLPDVKAVDQQFVAYMVGMNAALRSGYHKPQELTRIAPRQAETQSSTSSQNMNTYSSSQANGLGGDVVNHVRQLVAQGYRVGAEYADERRFQTSSWKSCAPIQATNESAVLRELEACLAEHAGNYVRLIGIDTRAKRRVLETIIQRPDGRAVQQSPAANGRVSHASAASATYRPSPSSNGTAPGGLPNEAVAMVRNLLAQGARVGTEHADARRFQTSSWHACSPIASNRESEVLSALQGCLVEHSGEYVRMFGIDPKAKRRIGELIVQRPNGKQVVSSGTATARSYTPPSTSSAGGGYVSTSQLKPEVAQQVTQLLNQGYRVGIEYADERRFRTSSWTTAAPIQGSSPSAVLGTIESFLAENARYYVRLVGIDSQAKRRVAEVIVHRPGNGQPSAPVRSAPASSGYASASSHSSSSHASSSYGAAPTRTSNSSGELANQVRQILMQGFKIAIEYADQRRYRTSSWQTGTPINSTNESAVVNAVQAFLSEHPNDYVRLIGIEPKAKRRTVETLIHKPGK